MQLLYQPWLPQKVLGQRFSPGVNALSSEPGFHHGGAIKAVVVEGIRDGTGKLPEGWIQHIQGAALTCLKPLLQWCTAWILQQIGQQIQERPDQVLGSPGVRRARGSVCIEQLFHQLSQQAGGEGEAQVRCNPCGVGEGELFPQPAAGRPSVHHHLCLLQQIWGLEAEICRQHRSEDLGTVTAEER